MSLKIISIEGYNERNGVPALSCSWSGPGWYASRCCKGVQQCYLVGEDRDTAEKNARDLRMCIDGYFETIEELVPYWREPYPNAKIRSQK